MYQHVNCFILIQVLVFMSDTAGVVKPHWHHLSHSNTQWNETEVHKQLSDMTDLCNRRDGNELCLKNICTTTLLDRPSIFYLRSPRSSTDCSGLVQKCLFRLMQLMRVQTHMALYYYLSLFYSNVSCCSWNTNSRCHGCWSNGNRHCPRIGPPSQGPCSNS